ncbi:4-hydroxy-tetrahydrodipicolinate synthase [hydrothermal vent metagenome]|uniref:4-hydroxy-tetrahydrodipicolinate synthase n=1 Tax=hydrothermal vent metagenome TaxID=652676 RepID=A0A3B0U8D5_9ZZZZ
MFNGSITALITPFRDGGVDKKALGDLVEWQIKEGTNGLVPVGTTGESPTVSHDEHRQIVSLVIEIAAGRVPVIAGAGSNSTSEAVALAKFARDAGADAILTVSPYYNKPNQEGLFQHFKAVAQAIDIPVILYNIPGRSIVEISVETMVRLREACPNIVGVKDATASMSRASLDRHHLGADFIQLSGEDITALGYNAHGGRGCISVTANVAPALCSRFQGAMAAGDFAKALQIQEKLVPLHTALFIEPNPCGVKYAAEKLGLCSSEVRLPLVAITEQTKTAIDKALAHAGLI